MCYTISGVYAMRYYNGDIRDTTNFSSTSYLRVNSCGVLSRLGENEIIFRQNGRVDYHIVYLLEGTMEAEYLGTPHTLKAGDFVFYPPNIPHRYRDFSETNRVWVHFAGQAIPEILQETQLKGGVYHLSPSSQLKNLFVELVAVHNSSPEVSTEKAIMLSILYQLGQHCIRRSDDTHQIDQCATYLAEHHNAPLSVQDLAEMCCLSQSRFLFLFKERFGMPPREYQTQLRIQSGKLLLSTTQLSISDISTMVGYEDPLYFSRIFKKYTGTSPRRYRQNCNSGF